MGDTDQGRRAIGEVLRSARTARGWSIRGLAERADVAPMTIQRVERGEVVRPESLRSLARAFELAEETFVVALSATAHVAPEHVAHTIAATLAARVRSAAEVRETERTADLDLIAEVVARFTGDEDAEIAAWAAEGERYLGRLYRRHQLAEQFVADLPPDPQDPG